ncbi:uncharacterized protein TRIADDRAFT_60494 [Trichoplax adhaerens]|uniref:Uncharacterized protein n=1 Tax=Trichoplax adhaerens TaxID=10228 RepID=B3S8D0_TRIAD|nr:hypothetical protein TRIADDRAFT_60494 [Trichoplax adhaerens]EDV21081.1 hypothetical protein TRIADDRAFT_60494 [Trichoplax adhaerens]|eukprot:XP_002116411.1 hypothetical protein TRIADDRAFT_60494 [Trichoplax adhaerens]
MYNVGFRYCASVNDKVEFNDIIALLLWTRRLNFNRLTFISSALCDGPYNMYHLDLSNNNLEEFGIEALLNCAHSLEILNMRRTHIARILPANKPMMAIQQVSLYMANINDNSAAALTKLKKIQDLNLSHQNLESLSDEKFKGLVKLRTLHLASNTIAEIHEDSFSEMSYLEEL